MAEWADEFNRIQCQLEDELHITFPDVVLRVTNSGRHAVAIFPTLAFASAPRAQKAEAVKRLDAQLALLRFTSADRDIDLTKCHIYVPRAYGVFTAQFYAALWEELAHVAAHVLGYHNMLWNEAFALAYRLKGLLQRALEGDVWFSDAVVLIEQDIAGASYNVALFSNIAGLGVSVPKQVAWANRLHYDALFLIRKFNPHLRFRDRDPHVLIAELTESIQYMRSWTKRLKTDMRRFFSKFK